MKNLAFLSRLVNPVKDILVRVAAPAGERFNAMSVREKMLSVLFSLVIVLALDIWLWAAPAIQGVAGNFSAKSALEAESAELHRLQEDAQKVAQQHDVFVQEFLEREKSLVGSEQVPALLENLSELARSAGVKITSLKPVEGPPPARGKYYSAVPIQLSAKAGTHETGRFLDELESGKILIKVTDLKIEADSSDERHHKIDLSLEAYRRTSDKGFSRA